MVAKKSSATKTRVISLAESEASEVVKDKRVKPSKSIAETRKKQPTSKKTGSVAGYFKGAWHELKLVRWPNRRQSWSLTLAVIIFSIVLGLMLFGLDALFTWIFKAVIL